MTRMIRVRFRRLLIILAVVPGVAALAVGTTAAAASAATTTPGYGHHQCDETLTYDQDGFYGGFTVVRDVCDVQVFREGYGRHNRAEDVFYQTERHGYLQDHFVRDVRDVEVYR